MFYVYLLASQPHGTLYVGKATNLLKRVYEHKIKAVTGFTAKYSVDRLVWFEGHAAVTKAIAREKQLKGWKRIRKIELIESLNPAWIDLSRQ